MGPPLRRIMCRTILDGHRRPCAEPRTHTSTKPSSVEDQVGSIEVTMWGRKQPPTNPLPRNKRCRS